MASEREALVERIRAEQEFWRGLVAEVGRDRMNEPGPMGEWTFKDLAAHLAGWRNRTISRLEAALARQPDPPPPWPVELDDDDSVNAWIREQSLNRSLDDLLADYDGSFDRLAEGVAALPERALTEPGYFRWLEGEESRALVDVDFTSHLHDEHLPSIRAWLARRQS